MVQEQISLDRSQQVGNKYKPWKGGRGGNGEQGKGKANSQPQSRDFSQSHHCDDRASTLLAFKLSFSHLSAPIRRCGRVWGGLTTYMVTSIWCARVRQYFRSIDEERVARISKHVPNFSSYE
uniref:Uncharacterized protein n=1 Tax=Timema bartmani TaxID=61472 RepID=A0A7R9F7F6_9NEOP|nr:unnamed protein product [Timema bartmani]